MLRIHGASHKGSHLALGGNDDEYTVYILLQLFVRISLQHMEAPSIVLYLNIVEEKTSHLIFITGVSNLYKILVASVSSHLLKANGTVTSHWP